MASGTVGAAPWESLRRNTVRAPSNPMDKTTIVSIYPKLVYDTKPTIQPGIFRIPAGSYEKPTTLIVGPSSWWKELPEEQPLLEIPSSSIQVADSVVRDYCIGILESNMGDCMPGLFYIPGSLSVREILDKHKQRLDDAKAKQDTWFHALVKAGDVLWARSNGNPLAVSDDMRMAAKTLGITKDWMVNMDNTEMVKCKACGVLVNSAVVVCPNCKVVLDAVKFKELGLSFA